MSCTPEFVGLKRSPTSNEALSQDSESWSIREPRGFSRREVSDTPEVLQDYAIRFRSHQYFIHHAPRRPYFGHGTNLWHMDPDGVWRKGSFGCVNMSLWSAARLFEWIEIGTFVRVVER
jgi:lipoprotein-anchoring transpeptidase ErfK/SrfK